MFSEIIFSAIFTELFTISSLTFDIAIFSALDIFSMAIARASDPKARNDTSGENTSYQRFRKQAQDVVAGIQKNGSIIAPDEATPEMIAKGVSETAENKTSASEQTGGNADYIASIYNNMVAARNEKSSN